MSYVESNLRSNGTYRYAITFNGLPDDETERNRYARFRRDIGDARIMVISRTVERETDVTEDGESVTETDTELTVFVLPTPQFIVDALSQLGSFESDGGHPHARYYSAASEYYESGVRNYVPTPIPVTETYCIDVIGLSPSRFRVVETVAGIR